MSDQTETPEPTITPEDLEAKFREIQETVDTAAETAKSHVMEVAIVVVVSVAVIAFVIGVRRGRKNRTVVEVRRL